MKLLILSITATMAISISQYAMRNKVTTASNIVDAFKKNATDTPITLLTYGLPEWQYDRAQHIIGAKYGITYIAVAGCEVGQPLLDSIHKHNKNSIAYLENKYGATFSATFTKEVTELLPLLPKIDAICLQDKLIAAKQKQLAKQDLSMSFMITLTHQKNVFTVVPTYYESLQGSYTQQKLHTVQVDLTNKKLLPL